MNNYGFTDNIRIIDKLRLNTLGGIHDKNKITSLGYIMNTKNIGTETKKEVLLLPPLNSQTRSPEEQIKPTIINQIKLKINNLWQKGLDAYNASSKLTKIVAWVGTILTAYITFINPIAPIENQFQDQLSQVYLKFFPVQTSMGELEDACLSNDKTKINTTLSTLITNFDIYLTAQRKAGKLISWGTYSQYVHPFNANVNYVQYLDNIPMADRPIVACKRLFSEKLDLNQLRNDVPNSISSEQSSFFRLLGLSFIYRFYNVNSRHYVVDFNKDLEEHNRNYELYYKNDHKS